MHYVAVGDDVVLSFSGETACGAAGCLASVLDEVVVFYALARVGIIPLNLTDNSFKDR